MSFIATDPTQATTTIANGWFPDIDLATMREAMQLDGDVTDARLKQALLPAMIDVNTQLAHWRMAQQTSGYLAMADVPAEQLDGVSVLAHNYTSAVFCLATALIYERHTGYDNKRDTSAERQMPVDDLRRDALRAIAQITGRRSTVIELI